MIDTTQLEAEKKFMLADDLIKNNKVDQAMELLISMVHDHPTFGRTYNHLGWIYETKLADLNKAEECYLLALKYDPNYRATYYNYAVILSSSHRFEELEKLLKTAMQIQGINIGTISNEFAIMYEMQARYDEAIEYYKKYIEDLFVDENINMAVEAIERCKKKRDILGKYN